MWENKAERVCRKVLDLVDKFLDNSERGCQQENRLEPLKDIMERIAELAQLVEGFKLDPSEAKLREISNLPLRTMLSR
jgi:hypothetical protein